MSEVGPRRLGGLLTEAGLLHHGKELLRWEALEVQQRAVPADGHVHGRL